MEENKANPPDTSTLPSSEQHPVFQYMYPANEDKSYKQETVPENLSDDAKGASIGRWSKEEHYKFIECIDS